MAQERFWKELYQWKVHAIYVELHLCEAEQWNRWIAVFMAIASSTSIGAWVIWRDLSFVWATIIAISQVLVAIRPHLPFNERVKAYSPLLHELDELFIQAESKWHEVSSGALTEAEINKERTNLRLQKHRLLKKHLPSTVIPDDKAKLAKAEDRALAYFSTFYPDERSHASTYPTTPAPAYSQALEATD